MYWILALLVGLYLGYKADRFLKRTADMLEALIKTNEALRKRIEKLEAHLGESCV